MSAVWLRLVLCLMAGVLATPASAADTIVDVATLSGERMTGRLTAWDASRLVVDGDQSREIAIRDVLSIRFPRHVRQVATGRCVMLLNGDRFAVDPVRTRDEQLTGSWTQAPLRPEVTFPLEAVAGMMFAAPPAADEFRNVLAAIGCRTAGTDSLRLIAGEDLAGEFQQLEGGLLEMTASVGELKLDRSRVRWLALDPDLGSFPEVTPPRWIAYLTDGSRITATECEPKNDLTVELAPVVGGRLTVPWHEISRLQRITARVAPLSEREPVAVEYQPYLSGHRAVTRNVSVHGSPLLIRGEEFALGLGVRSRTVLTYALEPSDRWFQTVVGIDDEANGRGSVRFRIAVDGREAWSSPEVTGRSGRIESPRIELSGYERLILTVEFGERGDLGDFADWCDPLIVREP